MNRVIGFLIVLITIGFHAYSNYRKSNPVSGLKKNTPVSDSSLTGKVSTASLLSATLFDALQLETLGLSKEALELALKGWQKMRNNHLLANDSILTIVDFSQPSSKKRLYILDITNMKLLFNTYVAHGRNSGKDQAVSYSNTMSSNKSSPGFYVTEDTYNGSNGFSLKLAGIEKGINDNAGRRAIVMHGAYYVSENQIHSQGYLGRSWGCPAIPVELAKPIINAIKGGSCLFIYAPSKIYAVRSQLLRGPNPLSLPIN